MAAARVGRMSSFARSGALTVSEIAAAGLPALFVPFQHKDRQQYWNALPLAKAGAAKIIEQSQLRGCFAFTLAGWSRETLVTNGRTRPRCIHSGCHRASGK